MDAFENKNTVQDLRPLVGETIMITKIKVTIAITRYDEYYENSTELQNLRMTWFYWRDALRKKEVE